MFISRRKYLEDLERARNEVHERHYQEEREAQLRRDVCELEKRVYRLEHPEVHGDPDANLASAEPFGL